MSDSAIPDFFDWFARQQHGQAPWLILGKGPSFSRLASLDSGGYRRISLNHAVRETPVDLAHMIDFDVVEACADAIEANAGALIVPWRPHVQHKPSSDTLEVFLQRSPLLQRLNAAGRLLTYNLASGRKLGHRDGFTEVPVRFFSFEAAFNLLAMGGVRQIRSLGVDGGNQYSDRFADLRDKTLLANGHASFDRQFAEIAATVRRHGVDYAPLDAETPVQVFVAATEDQMLSVEVLAHSIRRHSTMPVVVTPLHRTGIEVPIPRDPKNQARTPFSFQRFLIPQVRGYQGRAIYFDSDMQVFSDIRALWTLPLDGAQLLAVGDTQNPDRPPQFSVMLLDCAALDWKLQDIVRQLDSGELDYERLMRNMAVAPRVSPTIPPQWNSLEHYEAGSTSLLHYTDMPTQPWVSTRNKHGALWIRDLFDALDQGAIATATIEEHLRAGYIRPSLAWQVEHRVEDPLKLPAKALALDQGYEPPYKRLPIYQSPLATRPASLATPAALLDTPPPAREAAPSLWARAMRRLQSRFN
ncbi:MAG TPA: glycosyltransferase [Solimonas sp.]|nr:glycosyltransferase [Solimonas sp.]